MEDKVTGTEVLCTSSVLISTHGSVPANRLCLFFWFYRVELLTFKVIISRYYKMKIILQSGLKFLQYSTRTSWYRIAATLILRSYPFQNSASARCKCHWKFWLHQIFQIFDCIWIVNFYFPRIIYYFVTFLPSINRFNWSDPIKCTTGHPVCPQNDNGHSYLLHGTVLHYNLEVQRLGDTPSSPPSPWTCG